MQNRRAILAALLAGVSVAHAAPTITRLTPPSALFNFGDPQPPIIARFLPGQYFDLQVTTYPDAGQTITGVEFQVDGVPVTALDPLGNPVAYSPAVTTGLTGSLVLPNGATTPTPANTAVLSFRHYTTTTAGIHTLRAVVTQSDTQTSSAVGNFEIVPVPSIGRKAKNIIIMIGDGMGASHRTAARIVKNGVQQGKALRPLAMDLFPVTGMVETHSLNSIVTDSAPGAACYSTGNKSNNNQQGVFPDDTTNNGDNPRVELIGEYLARTQGKSLGIVTTSDVFDATPGAFASHTQARGAGTGICDYYLDEAVPKSNLKVLLGGGRKWFLPSTTVGTGRSTSTDYAYPTDVKTAWGLATGNATDVTRNLLGDFITAGFTYAPDRTSLNTIPVATTKLIGLFTFSNMNVAKDKIDGRRGGSTVLSGGSVVSGYGFPDQPTLDEMTDKAIQVLSQNPNGFVLMIEGASIDKQAHNMDTERWILDTVEFDYAADRVRQFAGNTAVNGETLALITADHECAGVAIIGASIVKNSDLTTRAASGLGVAAGGPRNGVVGTYEAAGFPRYPLQGDGYPDTMDVDYKMLIGYAANADRYEDWLTNPLPLRDGQQPTTATPYGGIVSLLPSLPTNRDTAGNFLVTGQVQDTSAAHTAGDIPISAIGRGASAFTGYMDNTDVFFKAMQAAIGGAK